MTKQYILTCRVLLWSFLFALVIFAAAANAAAQSATFSTRSYPLLGNTHVAADLNGDGKLDLAGSGATSAAVMLNNGDGTFQARVDYPVAGQTQDLAAGDFNSDGRMDLVVTINTLQISLSLLLGNGDGTFNAPVNFPNTSGFDSPDVVATDLNNDGKLDVVILHSIACFTAPCRAAETITVMLGNGDGTFQTRELAAPQHMHCLTAGDFNRDGIKDLAIGSENTKLHILLGVGDGTFVRQPEMTLIPGGDLFSACNDVDIADFNLDTIQDLVVPLGNGYGNVVLLGNGDGTFRQSFRITENAVSSPLNLAVADFNLDGLQDIARAMGDGTSGLMEIANGNGNGTFQAPVRYLAPPDRSSLGGIFIIASDFNGDGKPDVALLVGGASPSLRILINTTGAAPPPPPPAPVTVSALSLNPSTVTGGSSSTGKVMLSAQVQTSTVVALAPNNSAATVPSSVTVAAGASSANFTVNTTQVSVTTSATITATLNSSSRSASLTINTATPSVDTVSITRAEYETSKRALRVEATSTRTNATLQVFVTSTNQLIGTLTNEGGGKYRRDFSWSVNPQNITVRSSFGGQVTRTVTLK
jgi:hypothetical protein